uniref:Uncharacterized protein n=1 Tax=Arion vulgaris TaxID=1028688 RepID=A0A0B7A4A5_9EUPU
MSSTTVDTHSGFNSNEMSQPVDLMSLYELSMHTKINWQDKITDTNQSPHKSQDSKH